MSLKVFPFSEVLFTSALGVPPRNVANLRVKKLARGTDWELDGTLVVLAEKSLGVLTAALGVTLTPEEMATVTQKSRRQELPAEFTATVQKLPMNPKLLTVRWLEEGLERTANIITIRRDNFRVGMAVPIRLNPTTQRYELARRAPRMKGRW